jgi:hypothetical protein
VDPQCPTVGLATSIPAAQGTARGAPLRSCTFLRQTASSLGSSQASGWAEQKQAPRETASLQLRSFSWLQRTEAARSMLEGALDILPSRHQITASAAVLSGSLGRQMARRSTSLPDPGPERTLGPGSATFSVRMASAGRGEETTRDRQAAMGCRRSGPGEQRAGHIGNASSGGSYRARHISHDRLASIEALLLGTVVEQKGTGVRGHLALSAKVSETGTPVEITVQGDGVASRVYQRSSVS